MNDGGGRLLSGKSLCERSRGGGKVEIVERYPRLGEEWERQDGFRVFPSDWLFHGHEGCALTGARSDDAAARSPPLLSVLLADQ